MPKRDQVGALFYDRVMAGDVALPDIAAYKKKSPKHSQVLDRIELACNFIKECMPHATVVRMHNIMDWYAEQGEKHWTVEEDFPCLTPVFPFTWFEFRTKIYSQKNRNTAVLVLAHRLDTIEEVIDYLASVDGRREKEILNKDAEFVDSNFNPIKHDDNIKWERVEGSTHFYGVTAFVIAQTDNSTLSPLAGFGYAINDQGELIIPGLHITPIGIDFDEREELLGAANLMMSDVIFPSFLALTFMHCRNIALVQPERDGKFQRIWQGKTGEPLVSYNEIQINPIRKIMEAEGQIRTVGVKKSLHKVRGHFAHYGEKYGTGKLFGRVEGRFFIPQHARGTLDAGEIKQRYNVKP